jgi:hypothetical protein
VVVGGSMELGDLGGELLEDVLEEELEHEGDEKKHARWAAPRAGR